MVKLVNSLGNSTVLQCFCCGMSYVIEKCDNEETFPGSIVVLAEELSTEEANLYTDPYLF